MNENKPKLIIKSMENSNLFQRRLHHDHDDDSHNYDFIGGHEDVQSRNHKSNTNTLKSADKNDNFTKLNNSKGGGAKMEAQMGKSVKFEINKGSVGEIRSESLSLV